MAENTPTRQTAIGTIGDQMWRIRQDRKLSLRALSARTGIAASHLSEYESGKRVLDRIPVIVTIANGLEVAPSELVALPIPAPANGHTDSVIESIRLALDGIDIDRPGGAVVPVDVLRERVALIHRQSRDCQERDVSDALPALIRDLHTALQLRGPNQDELLELAVYLHVHITRMWLGWAGAPADLRRRAVFLARRLAEERNDRNTLCVAAFGVADVLSLAGAFDLAAAELDRVDLTAPTQQTVGLVAATTVARGMLSTVAERRADADSAMGLAADMTSRWGELGASDPLGFGFGPSNVGFRRVRHAVEAGEPDEAVRIAEQLEPRENPFLSSQSYFWASYGRALARIRTRYDGAVQAMRRAESLHPHRVYRDTVSLAVLADLAKRSKDDKIGREARAMAHRAGLRV